MSGFAAQPVAKTSCLSRNRHVRKARINAGKGAFARPLDSSTNLIDLLIIETDSFYSGARSQSAEGERAPRRRSGTTAMPVAIPATKRKHCNPNWGRPIRPAHAVAFLG